MKLKPNIQDRNPRGAFTRIELIVVMAIVFLLVGLSIPIARRAKQKTQRISCVSHLKQIGLAFRIAATNDLYPFAVSTNLGGTREFDTSTDFFRHWQAISNELGSILLATCPSDTRRIARDFTFLANSNISYFIGLEANETTPTIPLAGDRNLTNGRPVVNGVLSVSNNDNVGWTHELHQDVGNLLLSDGSVQQVTSGKLREAVRNSGATNGVLRLAMPE